MSNFKFKNIYSFPSLHNKFIGHQGKVIIRENILFTDINQAILGLESIIFVNIFEKFL